LYQLVTRQISSPEKHLSGCIAASRNWAKCARFWPPDVIIRLDEVVEEMVKPPSQLDEHHVADRVRTAWNAVGFVNQDIILWLDEIIKSVGRMSRNPQNQGIFKNPSALFWGMLGRCHSE
jgi:hypothetical protein